MSGWIFINKPNAKNENDIDKFKKNFSAENMGPPLIRMNSFDQANMLLTWGWRETAFSEDFVSDSGSGSVLILSGYLLDFGKFGGSLGDQAEDFNKLLALTKNYSMEEIVKELNGSFSVMQANFRTGQITLFTDRFASRSVWFYCRKNERIAANFPASIPSFMTDKIRINEAGLWSLLATSRHVGSQGIFKDIHNLQAGQKAVLNQGGTFIVTDWYLRRYKPELGKSPRYWGGVIAETLKNSAAKHKKVTSRPYLFLSGGLDSRLVAGAYGKDLRTLTLTTHPNMNSRISERVASHLRQKHRTIIRTPYWYLDTFEASALIAGGNYNIAHSHFIVPILETLKTDPAASFLLGDLLENFNKHYFKEGDIKLDKMTARDVPDQFHKLFGFTHKDPQSLLRLFKGDFGKKAYESWRETLKENFNSIESVSKRIEDRLDTLFRWGNCSICPTYLMLESMLPFAPIRNLMFDNDMLDLLLKIPAEVRGAKKLHKWTLWSLDKKLALIPDSNFWLPPIFPLSILKLSRKLRPHIGNSRRKIISLYKKGPISKTEGSWHMNHIWYRKDQKYRGFIENQVVNDNSFSSEVFNHSHVKNSWLDFISGDSSKGYEIDLLLSFVLMKINHKMVRKFPESSKEKTGQ